MSDLPLSSSPTNSSELPVTPKPLTAEEIKRREVESWMRSSLPPDGDQAQSSIHPSDEPDENYPNAPSNDAAGITSSVYNTPPCLSPIHREIAMARRRAIEKKLHPYQYDGLEVFVKVYS